MGHLINPISNRLSINSLWSSNWSLVNNFNYVNIFKKDYILFQFLNWFKKRSKFLKFNLIISHYKIFKIYKSVFINLYYYHANIEEKKYHFQVIFLLRLLREKKNYWYKRNNKLKYEHLNKLKYEHLNKLNDERINKLNNVYRFKWLFFKEKASGERIYKLFFVRPKFFRKKKKSKNKRIKNLYIYFIKIIVANLCWYITNKFTNFYLSKLIFNNEKYYFNIYNLNFLSVTTEIISTYIAARLQQRYTLNWVLRPVLKDLAKKMKKNIFLGYKIVCSGRFTRKQIATYMWMKKGSLQFNTFTNLIRYSESSVKLKYGLCGIKVWLGYGLNNLTVVNRNLLLIYPKYTPFKYLLGLKHNIITFYINYWFYLYSKIRFLKSKIFNLYKIFINIKTKILIRYLLKRMVQSILNTKFKILYFKNNKLIIKLNIKKLNFSRLLL